MFVRELTLATFDGIANYHDLMETQLKLVKATNIDVIREKLGTLALSEEEYFAERDLMMQEHSAEFTMLFPNFLRFSYVVLLYLAVENKLHDLCGEAKRVRNVASPLSKPRHSIISGYKTYVVNDLGISGLDWDCLYELSKVRNCIVHSSGKVDVTQGGSDLRNLLGKVPGFRISTKPTYDTSDLQPLYLESNMLMLEPEYCKYATNKVRSFFERFCDEIPLTPFFYT